MGTISAGVGLISGIDTASLIEQLLAIESRGRVTLQQRIARIQGQQTAMLDINSRLLNFKKASEAFRKNDIFRSANATTSNESVLTATAEPGAIPGSYAFTVDRLVQSSQVMTRGFSNLNDSALGMSRMTFEFGNGRLERNQDLASLRGGQGVRRGKIVIEDASGASAMVDLSRASTVRDVLDAINNAEGVQVTAAVNGDALMLTDHSGGGGSMTVSSASGSFTATDLGIAGNDAGSGTITGEAINAIGLQSSLSELNDGNGVLISSGLGNPDFRITDRNGVQHDIVLGRFDNNGTIENAVETVEDVIERIDRMTGGAVSASIAADGVSLELTDNSGGAGTFSVSGAGLNGEKTARDLGLLNGGEASDTISGERIVAGLNSVLLRSLDGGGGVLAFGGDGTGSLQDDTLLADLFGGAGIGTNGDANAPDVRIQDRSGATFEIELDGLRTVEDLRDAVSDATEGGVTLSIDGNALVATNTTTGESNFQIQDINGSTSVADLGLTIDSAPGGVNAVKGIDTTPRGTGGTTLEITNRNGGVSAIDLSSAKSVSDVINLINAAGAGVQASLNEAGNGLKITDTTGGAGNLIVGGDASDDLGLTTGAAGHASDTVAGVNLQVQYVSGSSRLSGLNYGRGIGTGAFRITDADGDSAEVDIGTDAKNLQDIIAEINSKGLDILARVNDNGDGLIIESTSTTGTLALRVENVRGSAARDLGILGTAANGTTSNFIDGSFERTIDLSESDTLGEVTSKLNGAEIPIAASIVNTGSGPNPFRLTLSSEISGELGDMSIDAHGFDLGMQVLSRGEDARVFFGSTDPAQAVIITSSSNTLDNVIDDVKLDLKGTSTSPVTINVSRDQQAILDAVQEFVTTFNDVIGRINQYDRFNAETEERGPLLGDPTVARVRNAMFRTLQREAIGVDGSFRFLSQVGIRSGENGTLAFDQEKFTQALQSDPDAVRDLFVAFDVEEVASGDLGDGVTSDTTTEQVNRLGVIEQFVRVLDRLTNSVDGTVTNADQNFENQIELLRDRIEAFDRRLEDKRSQLEREFAAMESALAQLQDQQSALGNIQNIFATR